ARTRSRTSSRSRRPTAATRSRSHRTASSSKRSSPRAGGPALGILAGVSAPDLSGEVLDDRYQIFERISEGAMGVVYRGIRIKLERQVAIKVMHSVLPGAMQGRQRFEREAQLMARLDHPHVVSIIDFGIHHDKPYVVMELVRGVSLYDMLADHGRFESPRAI